MPLYEYRCRRCRRRFTKLFRSIATAGDPGPCPHCGGTEVDRLLSRIVVQRRHPERSEPLDRVEWSNEEPEASEFPTSWGGRRKAVSCRNCRIRIIPGNSHAGRGR
jgi:putative FmdB family regulatory protein